MMKAQAQRILANVGRGLSSVAASHVASRAKHVWKEQDKFVLGLTFVGGWFGQGLINVYKRREQYLRLDKFLEDEQKRLRDEILLNKNQTLKLKNPMVKDYGSSSMEAFNNGKRETKLHYKAILAKVKERDEAMYKRHREELDVIELQGKLSVLDQLEPIFETLKNQKEKLEVDLEMAQAKLDDVNVPNID